MKSVRINKQTLRYLADKLEESGCSAICITPKRQERELTDGHVKMVNHDTSITGHYLHEITVDDHMIGNSSGHLVCRL